MRRFLNRYYQKKISALPQFSRVLPSRHCVCGIDPPPLSEAQAADKHRLAILVDKRGWAYHEKAEEKSRYLGPEWQTEIFFLEDTPVIDPKKFDLLYNFNHTPSKYDKLFHGRLIKGLYSHYHQGSFIPWRYIFRMVRHAAVLVVANQEQAEEIRPFFRNTVVLPDGVDTEVFYPETDRSGQPIVAGWSGNPDRKLNGRRVKRFYEVVEPACKAAGVELKVARDLSRDDLRKMYNEVDVVLIASVTEGNPLCLFEAGACARTVIATSVGVVPELIKDGVDGFIIDSTLPDLETSDLMTLRLKWCQEHPTETQAMGQRLREKILRDRTAAEVSKIFRQLLDDLLTF